MAVRENCRHYESRTYDDGEVARFCVLDLAPEAPWRCPDDCPRFELGADDGSFQKSSLIAPPVEDEPDDDPEEIAAILHDAEEIVAEAAPVVIAGLDHRRPARRGWMFWKKPPPDDGEFHLSNR